MGAYRSIPESVPKWLRVHNSQEWPNYYSDSSCRDLKRFFDCVLEGDAENGWLHTPEIRLSILNFGLDGLYGTLNRAGTTWPFARPKYQKVYLTPDRQMSPSPLTQVCCLRGRSAYRQGVLTI